MFVQACLCRNPKWKFITIVYTIDGVSFNVYECQNKGCMRLRLVYLKPQKGNGEDK